MKKIICGVIALLVGIVALNAETIDNKPTQDDATTILRHKKRSFIYIYDESGDITDKVITKEVLDNIKFVVDDGNKDMEVIDKGDYIEVRKKGSPKSDSK